MSLFKIFVSSFWYKSYLRVQKVFVFFESERFSYLFLIRKVFVSLASERFSYLLDPKDSPEGRPAESPLVSTSIPIHPADDDDDDHLLLVWRSYAYDTDYRMMQTGAPIILGSLHHSILVSPATQATDLYSKGRNHEVFLHSYRIPSHDVFRVRAGIICVCGRWEQSVHRE